MDLVLTAQIASVAIALVAIFISLTALRYSRSSLHFDVLSKMADEAFSKDFSTAMMVVTKFTFRNVDEYKAYVGQCSDDERAKIEDALTRVMRFFDTLGVYVEQKIFDRDLVMEVFGSYIVNAYHHTAFYVNASFLQDRSYPRHFKRLAEDAETAGYKPYAVWQREMFDEKVRKASAPGASLQDKTFG